MDNKNKNKNNNVICTQNIIIYFCLFHYSQNVFRMFICLKEQLHLFKIAQPIQIKLNHVKIANIIWKIKKTTSAGAQNFQNTILKNHSILKIQTTPIVTLHITM